MTGRKAFIGPTLTRAVRDELVRSSIAKQIDMAPPAQCGDIAQAVRDGFAVVVLIDGIFGESAPPRHKEILFALANGLTVIGAASLGALRACECAAFGMIGIGKIFEAYRDGRLVADDAVATLHGPPELGHCALTDPLVTIEANLSMLLSLRLISDEESDEIFETARKTHFSHRNALRLILETVSPDPGRARQLELALRTNWKDPKADDALEALRFAIDVPAIKSTVPKSWVWADTHHALECISTGNGV